MRNDIPVFVPTYNEADNIQRLLNQIPRSILLIAAWRSTMHTPRLRRCVARWANNPQRLIHGTVIVGAERNPGGGPLANWREATPACHRLKARALH
jgi:hypothetical protein